MKKYLIICEKRLQAESISQVLKLKKKGMYFEGPFKDGTAVMVYASGHLLRLKLPDEIIPDLKWSDPPTAYCPIPRNYDIIVNDDGKGRVKGLLSNIKTHMKDADSLILSLDSDNEGEAIGRNIVTHFKWKKEIFRAWLSGGLDNTGINNAFNNLKGEFDTMPRFRAAEARQRTDRLYTYLTRAYSFYAKYNKFGTYLSQGVGKGSVVSVGRLQTVIVSIVGERDEEIKNFKSQNHFTLNSLFNFKGAEIEAKLRNRVTEDIINAAPEGIFWEQQKATGDNIPLDKPLYIDKRKIMEFTNKLEENKQSATISSSKSNTENDFPPITMELADAQMKVASSIGVSGSLAQVILEDLYEQGWLTYARTGHAELPKSLYEPANRNGMINAVINLPSLSNAAKLVRDIHDNKNSQYKPFLPKCFSDKEMEHYGIVPTSEIMTPTRFAGLKPQKLSGKKVLHTSQNMMDAYEVIAERFLTAMLPPAQYSSQSIEVTMPVPDLLGHPDSVFHAKARKLIDAGWKGVFGNSNNTNTTFPDLSVNDNGELISTSLSSKRTKPPKPYTLSTLPKKLANIGKEVRDPKLRALLVNSKGIGQPATRITGIETVIARGYLGLKGDTLGCQTRGYELLKYTPKWLKQPETSASLEDYMNKIATCSNDVDAIAMRDRFEEIQLERIETLINHMITKFQSDLGEVAKKVPKEVSAKMKKLIKSIAAKKNIPIPRGTLSDPMMAADFLDTHIEKADPATAGLPTESTINYAKKIEAACPDNVIIDQNMYNNSVLLKEFINKNKKYMPPTEGQIKFVRSLVKKLPEGVKPPSDVETSADAARKFIDKYK